MKKPEFDNDGDADLVFETWCVGGAAVFVVACLVGVVWLIIRWCT
jgi:hypothetical protein